MPATSILGGISQEATQQELLAHATILLAAILESMPRTDANARAIVNTSDQGAMAVGTVTTVTTVGNQTNIGGRDASNTTYALANMGTAHIYNNIIVS